MQHPPSGARGRLGVDLGGTKIAAARLTADGGEIDRRRTPTPRSYQGVLDAIRDLADQLDPSRDTPLGVGIPGSVSPTSGRIRNANTTFLNGRDLLGDLRSATGRPVRLANDADCFALSEATDGAAAGAATAFGMIIGTGCGGGVVVEGRLLPGASGIAGEVGHVPLPWASAEEHPGPLCWCGRRGCLETWISGSGFERDYAARPGAEPGLHAPAIVARAGEGEPVAAAALDAYVSRLGRALAMLCNLLDPEVVVLGGGMSNVGALYPRLPDAMRPFVFSDALAVRVVRNLHGDDSGVRGAAWLWPAQSAGRTSS